MTAPSSPFKDRSVVAQTQIFSTDFYSAKYLACLKKLDMTSIDVEKKNYTPEKLHTLWEEFWWQLPDSSSIRRDPFFLICELCEEEL